MSQNLQKFPFQNRKFGKISVLQNPQENYWVMEAYTVKTPVLNLHRLDSIQVQYGMVLILHQLRVISTLFGVEIISKGDKTTHKSVKITQQCC